MRINDMRVQTAAIKYFAHKGIPTFSAAEAARDFVFNIAREAQANSVAKIPSPASKTNIPGPGAKRKIVPTTVIKPPTTPMKTRQIREPYGVDLNCWRIFTRQDYPKSMRERNPEVQITPEKVERVCSLNAQLQQPRGHLR